jgi:hypothetical protein
MSGDGSQRGIVGLRCAEKHRGERLPLVSPLVTLRERQIHVASVGEGSEDAAVGEWDGVAKAGVPGHTRDIVTPPHPVYLDRLRTNRTDFARFSGARIGFVLLSVVLPTR